MRRDSRRDGYITCLRRYDDLWRWIAYQQASAVRGDAEDALAGIYAGLWQEWGHICRARNPLTVAKLVAKQKAYNAAMASRGLRYCGHDRPGETAKFVELREEV